MLELAPGHRFYCGYHEWAVHPAEAAVILDRGYVIVNGRCHPAKQVDELNGYPLIRIEDLPGDRSDPQGQGLDVFVIAAVAA